MRILVAVPGDNEIGGVASIVGNLAKFLQGRGHRLFFLHSSAATILRHKMTRRGFQGFGLRMQMPLGERTPIVSLLLFTVFFPISLYQLVRLIQNNGIEVVNVHYPTDFFFYFGFCRRLLPIKLVTSIHGADVFTNGKPRREYSRAFRFLLSSSDVIVAPSKKFQQEFMEALPEFRNKTTFIHNCVDLTELDREAAESPEGDQPSGSYLFCLSAYKPQKAIDVLLRAFKLVQARDPTIRLIVAGPGDRGEFEKLADELNISKKVELKGPTQWPEAMKLLRACTAFVLPSRFETFGIVVLEAMACEKAVVGTTAGGIPEIIENGKNGLLVNPDDEIGLAEALVAILKDEPMRAKLASAAYVSVHARFGLENTGTAYEDLFADLMADSAFSTAASQLQSRL
jgi:glycosyltransferase involved in cell wall biosynthesis